MRLPIAFNLFVAAAGLLFISACSPSAELIATEAIDPTGGLSREDYLALRERGGEAVKKKETPPAAMNPEIEKSASLARLNKPVSVNVTEAVPVRDVLMELVSKTGLNMQIDPRVQGAVILSAKDQPFGQVLRRICEMADLRYTVDGAFIRIEPDEPYQKSYRLDYLSLHRRATSDTSIATNVFDVDVTTGGTNGSGGASTSSASAKENNSTAKVQAVSEANFWAETEKSVAQILGAGEARKGTAKATFSIDRQAGIVTVFSDQKRHQAVERYFSELRRKSSAQVLIDARIIEVELDEAYKSGIDWSGIVHDLGAQAIGAAASFGTKPAFGTNGFFTLGVDANKNFGGMINLVQTFGTTRVLSAPRLTVLNNQTAVMKVATNQVYFVTQAQFTTTTNATGALITTNPIYTSTPHTVPVGLVMTVQPSIDAENNRVTMTLRPTISRVVGQVDDPSIGLNAAIAGVADPIHSKVPVLAVREMDSVIQLKSGEIAVLGGLMQDSSINEDKGIPGLADIYGFGNLFKSRDNDGKVSELVILLRATISDQPEPDGADSMLYEYYNRDPRPVKMPQPSLKPMQGPDEPDSTT